MTNIKIDRKQARKIFLSCQGLNEPAMSAKEIIERLGYVQIDTLSVVERAHHHVFWSRNQSYDPKDLERLVAGREVFEYWSHAASFLPMSDYRFSLPRKREFRKKSSNWLPRDLPLMKKVLNRIRSEGPLRSADFVSKKSPKSGWNDGNPVKKALERLFMEGDLVISGRKGFQKIYDIPERIIPDSVDSSMPSEAECARKAICTTLGSHGMATLSDIAYMKPKDGKNSIAKMLSQMVREKAIANLSINGLPDDYYCFPATLENSYRPAKRRHLLSPFDNAVIQRKKLSALFDFDYQLECYVTEAKRKYGYFCLPLLEGDRFTGRIDCKADRKTRTLHIRRFHTEASVDRQAVISKAEDILMAFAAFNQCDWIEMNDC